MTEATSCGGVVIFRGKILLLYKSYKNRYDGWVLPKGTVEQGETHEQTALREVKEETDADASIIKYVGKSEYSFYSFHEQIIKSVHWYLMESENYHSSEGRVFCRLRVLQISRGLPLIEISQRERNLKESV